MTYAEYLAADVDEKVIIEAYVQAHQSWWDNKVTVYLADRDGAYFAYEMACSEKDAAKLTPGTKIKVTGYKTVWEGEIEIVDATFTFVENADLYVAPAKNLTDVLGTDNLINYQNQLASFKNLTVKSITYKNGTPGDDIYVTFTKGGVDYDFCVERYLTGPETDLYKAFEDIKAGDVITVEGFVYWYANKINTHITKISEAKSEGVMSYVEYMEADVDDDVVIEAYVQAHQSWWNNKITLYLADFDGAYFAYEMACSEEDAAKLVPGVKVKISGYKAIWEGEVEIMDGTLVSIDESMIYMAPSKDLTNVLGTELLINYQNQLAYFRNLRIKSITYKNGTPGDDIYVTFTKGGVDYDFCVERYLTGPETDLYKAFETLVVGDVVNVEGFLYWYTNVNTHITAINKVKSAGTMTYDEYMAADVDDEVVIEAYVQAHQSWWSNKITVYLADLDGAYFAYEMACTEEDAAKLVPGTKIKVSGYKAIWEGEVEIMDATFTFVKSDNGFVADAKDLTNLLGTDELINYQNQLASFRGLTIKSISYKNGEPGDDIYVTFTKNGADYDFCVERYLTGPETDLYKAFETLAAGDVVDVEGYLYWYTNVNTHITKITKVA